MRLIRLTVVLFVFATLSGCFLFGTPEISLSGPTEEGGPNVALGSGDTINWPTVVTAFPAPTTASVTVTITNPGTAPLEFNGSGPNYISITSDPASLFTLSEQPQPALAPGDTHDFLITLNADGSDTLVTGTVTIATNDPDTPAFTLSLTGEVANS